LIGFLALALFGQFFGSSVVEAQDPQGYWDVKWQEEIQGPAPILFCPCSGWYSWPGHEVLSVRWQVLIDDEGVFDEYLPIGDCRWVEIPAGRHLVTWRGWCGCAECHPPTPTCPPPTPTNTPTVTPTVTATPTCPPPTPPTPDEGTCQSASALIDEATLDVTGTGNGEGDEWQVVRLSDGAVMDSGLGNQAGYSFAGAYEEDYQLQFRFIDGSWSTERCTFSFETPVTPTPQPQPVTCVDTEVVNATTVKVTLAGSDEVLASVIRVELRGEVAASLEGNGGSEYIFSSIAGADEKDLEAWLVVETDSGEVEVAPTDQCRIDFTPPTQPTPPPPTPQPQPQPETIVSWVCKWTEGSSQTVLRGDPPADGVCRQVGDNGSVSQDTAITLNILKKMPQGVEPAQAWWITVVAHRDDGTELPVTINGNTATIAVGSVGNGGSVRYETFFETAPYGSDEDYSLEARVTWVDKWASEPLRDPGYFTRPRPNAVGCADVSVRAAEYASDGVVRVANPDGTYTVKAGDTIAQIAKSFGTGIWETMEANPDLQWSDGEVVVIEIGQVLNLPVVP